MFEILDLKGDRPLGTLRETMAVSVVRRPTMLRAGLAQSRISKRGGKGTSFSNVATRGGKYSQTDT